MPAHGGVQGPDSVGGPSGGLGAGDIELTVDFGDTTMRNDRSTLEATGQQLEEDHDIDTGATIDVDRAAAMNEQYARAQEQAAVRRAADEAKQAEMAEAHENGEAYYWGDTTHEGESVEEWILPDGTTILVDDDGQAVAIDYPPGGGPIYIGDITYQGEPHAVYEMPGGVQVVINDDGDVIGQLDDLDYSITVPLGFFTGDNQDLVDGTMVTVTATPLGPPTYDTVVVDAVTGEVYDTINTGNDVLGVSVGQGGTDIGMEFSTYQPPGADYALVIDASGTVVDTVNIPVEPEWSILGIVEYYEDGTVVIDVGAVEVSVDVIGPEGGISVDFDVLIAEGTAGIEWNEDGSWGFDTGVGLGIGAVDVTVDVAFGQDAKGNGYLDMETTLEMTVGVLRIEGGQHFHAQQTDDGFELNVGMDGKVGAFGMYLSREQDLSIVLDKDGLATTYQDTIGAGINGLGGVEFTSFTQVRTDGTLRGTSATQGADAALVDADGDRVLGGGVYADTKGGVFTSGEILGDGRDYEREYDEPELPATPDGGADFEFDGRTDAGAKPDSAAGGAVRDKATNVPRDAFDQVDDRDADDAADGAQPARTTQRAPDMDGAREPIDTAVNPNVLRSTGEPALPHKALPRDETAWKSTADSVMPRSRNLDDVTDGEPALPHKVAALKIPADSVVPRARNRADAFEDIADGERPVPFKGGAPDASTLPTSADSAPRSRNRSDAVDDLVENEPALPHKALPRDETAWKGTADSVVPRSRNLDDIAAEPALSRDGDAPNLPYDKATPKLHDRVLDDDVTASDTDIPADDITTMTTGETADGGTDGLEVGRAPVRIDPSVSDRLDQPLVAEGDITREATGPGEPLVAEGDFVVERLDTPVDPVGVDSDGGDLDGIGEVEAEIAAVIEPEPMAEPEPMIEPEPIDIIEPPEEAALFDNEVIDGVDMFDDDVDN